MVIGRTTKFMAAAAMALAVGAALQLAVYSQPPSQTTAHASWVFNPRTVSELKGRSRAIVLTEVVSVERGDDLVSEQPGEPGGVSRIPTQRVSVQVIETFKGAVNPGQTLTLFQTGGSINVSDPPAPGEGQSGETDVQQLVLEGDPPYVPGEEYLLMLEPGPGDTVRPVSPEGRYRHDARSGVLTAVAVHGSGVANEIASRRLAELGPVLRSRG